VGGGLVSLAAGIAIMAALQGLGQTHHRGSPHFGPGVDIAVGILGLVIAGVLVLRRRRRVRDPAGVPSGRPGGLGPIQRLLANGSPRGMFVLGTILGSPVSSTGPRSRTSPRVSPPEARTSCS
jgi:MYXO-CTERM domain-containing protein